MPDPRFVSSCISPITLASDDVDIIYTPDKYDIRHKLPIIEFTFAAYFSIRSLLESKKAVLKVGLKPA